jgi:hypothetical protein
MFFRSPSGQSCRILEDFLEAYFGALPPPEPEGELPPPDPPEPPPEPDGRVYWVPLDLYWSIIFCLLSSEMGLALSPHPVSNPAEPAITAPRQANLSLYWNDRCIASLP